MEQQPGIVTMEPEQQQQEPAVLAPPPLVGYPRVHPALQGNLAVLYPSMNPELLRDTGEMALVLVPFGDGAKYLKPFCFRRDQGNTHILIGRNEETGLDKACPNVLYLSRSHVAVMVKGNGKIYMSAIARQDRVVSMNGVVVSDRKDVELHVGGRFSLLGSIDWFNYVLITASNYQEIVRMVQSTAIHRAHTTSSSANEPMQQMPAVGNKRERQEDAVGAPVETEGGGSSSNKRTVRNNEIVTKSTLNGLFHQFDCPICYDTMASVCTLSSCGCNFCYHCIETWYCVRRKNQCPCCNQTFELPKSVANKRMDTVIREFLKIQATTEKEIDDWEDRVVVGIQRRKAYDQLHGNNTGRPPLNFTTPFPHLAQAPAPAPALAPAPVATPAPAAAPTGVFASAPAPHVVELILRRAPQVIALAALPENLNNALIQGRARTAQTALNQINAYLAAQGNAPASNA